MGEILASILGGLFDLIGGLFSMGDPDLTDAQREHQADLDEFQSLENEAKSKADYRTGKPNELLG